MRKLTKRVVEILSWYPSLTDGQKGNFARILNHGALAGTGKLVILPVDQGFEHGPDRSFASNPLGYDPCYHAQLAIDGEFSAHAASLGAVEAVRDIIRDSGLPLILKCNSHDLMMPDDKDPFPAVTAWVDDAVKRGIPAVGFSIYSGSSHSREMYQQVRELVRDAKQANVIVVIWAYPRGSGLPTGKEAETAIDVVAYAVHIACQLGAHIIKTKPPTEKVVLPGNDKIYEKIPRDTLANRVRHVVSQAAFGGRRIVLFSGQDVKTDQEILAEIRQLREGGAFGSIIGRNVFKRPKDQALTLVKAIVDIYNS